MEVVWANVLGENDIVLGWRTRMIWACVLTNLGAICNGKNKI